MSSECKCYFKKCSWCGDVDDLFDHCEIKHRNFIIEINGNKKQYKFPLKDLKQNVYLLCLDDGLYWFIIIETKITNDGVNNENIFGCGVFLTPTSPSIEYTLKIGTKRNDGFANYIGPFECNELNSVGPLRLPIELYQCEINDYINDNISECRLFLEPVNDDTDGDDQFVPDEFDVLWTTENLEKNQKLINEFVCIVCLEYLKTMDIHSCDNGHFICGICIQKNMEIRKSVKCTLCQLTISYDSRCIELEKIAKVLHFPTSASDDK